jgi:hypothetical protein
MPPLPSTANGSVVSRGPQHDAVRRGVTGRDAEREHATGLRRGERTGRVPGAGAQQHRRRTGTAKS